MQRNVEKQNNKLGTKKTKIKTNYLIFAMEKMLNNTHLGFQER